MTKTLKELYQLVENQCSHYDKYEKVFEGQTWKYHILCVINNAIKFAKERGGDVEVVEIAALFHDYANLVDFEKYSIQQDIHHIASGDLAEPILLKYGYKQEFIDKVKKCIYRHRASVVQEKNSIEELCLADADAVTHIENVFEIIMWRGYRRDSIEDANRFVKNKLMKSFAKLSDDAKNYIRDKYESALKIFY